jgi:hypothetical protein
MTKEPTKPQSSIKMRDLRILEGYTKELSLLATVNDLPRDVSLLVRKLETIVDKLIGDAEYGS